MVKKPKWFVKGEKAQLKAGNLFIKKKDVQQDKAISKVSQKINRLSFSNTRIKEEEVGIATYDNTFSEYLLNGMQTGVSEGLRNGRQTICKYLEIRLTLKKSLTTTVRSFIRVMLLIDKSPQGATLVDDDVLKNFTTMAQPMDCLTNHDNRARFKILKDKVFSFDDTQNTQAHVKWNINLKGLKTYFNINNVGSITDIEKGALYLVIFSSESTYTPSVSYNYRLTYEP